jgi:hypothetical protein
LGYLHSTPKDWQETRLDMMRRTGQGLDLPELAAGDYLVDALFKAGPTKAGGMGEVPMDWLDIWAFAQSTGDVSEPWEAEALHSMSRAYLAAKTAGENPLAIPPIEQDAADG